MCARVARPFTSWRRPQNPPVIVTSSRPRGRSAPVVGATGTEWVVVVVSVMFIP